MSGGTGDGGSPGPTGRLGLYVHFPFCAHRCHYCDYAVEPSARPPVGSWLRALEAELDLRFRAEGWTEPPRVATVYVGGGTPSLLGVPGMERLASLLHDRFAVEDDVEWTLEANPADVDHTAAVGWKRAGVTRVNLGVQSFHDGTLRWLGRLHDASAARRAVELLQTAGPPSVAVDLLYGVPVDVGRSWTADLDRVREMEISHVTLYGLSAEPGTPLGRWVRSGRVSLPDEEIAARQYLRASRRLGAAGWEHYEVTGLARPGGRCRHNLRYWTGVPYLGLGPSAHGLLPPRRSWNVASWREYRKSIEGGSLPVASRERPSAEERRTERIWLRLHTRDGIEGALARQLRQRATDLVGTMAARGWISPDDGAISPTPEGWLRLDDMAAALAAALDGPASPGDSGPRRAAPPAEQRDSKGAIP